MNNYQSCMSLAYQKGLAINPKNTELLLKSGRTCSFYVNDGDIYTRCDPITIANLVLHIFENISDTFIHRVLLQSSTWKVSLGDTDNLRWNSQLSGKGTITLKDWLKAELNKASQFDLAKRIDAII
jgi:hypothetical protein